MTVTLFLGGLLCIDGVISMDKRYFNILLSVHWCLTRIHTDSHETAYWSALHTKSVVSVKSPGIQHLQYQSSVGNWYSPCCWVYCACNSKFNFFLAQRLDNRSPLIFTVTCGLIHPVKWFSGCGEKLLSENVCMTNTTICQRLAAGMEGGPTNCCLCCAERRHKQTRRQMERNRLGAKWTEVYSVLIQKLDGDRYWDGEGVRWRTTTENFTT